MSAPFSQLRSKHNRAIVAYLISKGCGSTKDTFPAEYRGQKTYPNTTVRSTIARPEVLATGLYRITTHISIKGSATQDKSNPNPGDARVQFDARVASVQDAMMQTDDGQTLRATAVDITAAGRATATAVDQTPEAVQFAANNADMVDYTCEALFDQGFGDGAADEEGCSWEEILIHEALACASNVD